MSRHPDMYKPILLLGSLCIFLTAVFIGAGLSNAEIQPVGFITLGIGFGGFFLEIVGLLVITSLMSRRAEKKAKAPRLTGFGGFGKVTAVNVDPDSDDDAPRYIITVTVNKDTPVCKFTCQKRHYIGDTVEFRGNPRIPATLKLLDEYYYESRSKDE